MKKVRIKVCGMKYPSNIMEVDSLKVDYLGFIFYEKSKRNAEDLNCIDIQNIKARKIGVFVNAENSYILSKIEKFSLHGIQLHGEESPEQCGFFKDRGLEVFKAFAMDDIFDFDILNPYVDHCHYFLFDTKGKEKGGNGFTFNWNILKKYKLDKPFILSGGLSPENIELALKIQSSNLYALDLNSGFEIEPGLKNVETLKNALNLIRK